MNVLVIISEASGESKYTRYALSPEGMDRPDAAIKTQIVIDSVKREDPEYEWIDIEDALEQAGFSFPQTIECYSTW